VPLPLYSSSSWLPSSCIAGASESGLRRNNVGSAIFKAFGCPCAGARLRAAAAIAFHEKRGFRRIAPFDDHVNDATSLCYELQVERQRQAMEV
jgi:hypothetical protein